MDGLDVEMRIPNGILQRLRKSPKYSQEIADDLLECFTVEKIPLKNEVPEKLFKFRQVTAEGFKQICTKHIRKVFISYNFYAKNTILDNTYDVEIYLNGCLKKIKLRTKSQHYQIGFRGNFNDKKTKFINYRELADLNGQISIYVDINLPHDAILNLINITTIANQNVHVNITKCEMSIAERTLYQRWLEKIANVLRLNYYKR